MEILQLHNSELTEELRTEGKVTFPLLNETQVDTLKALFNTYHESNPEGFYATTHVEDKSFRKEVSDEILTIISSEINKAVENIHVLGGAFISKAPGEKGILPLHQDWNIVNELEARSYNLWIPLVDVNEHNGAMRILEKSHLKQDTYRGPNLHPVLYSISEHVDEHMVSLNMKAGEGLLYDHALWHSSPVNQSNELRLAIVFGVIPNGVEMKFYHQKDNGTVEEYISHPNFFFENDPEDGPKGLTLNRSIAHSTSMLTQSEFDKVYLGRTEPEMKKSKGLFGLFKRSKA